jgi:hypothetical protein
MRRLLTGYAVSFNRRHRRHGQLFQNRYKSIVYIDVDEFSSKGKQQKKVKARSLFCYWAVNELGVSLTELARKIGINVQRSGTLWNGDTLFAGKTIFSY